MVTVKPGRVIYRSGPVAQGEGEVTLTLNSGGDSEARVSYVPLRSRRPG